MKNLFLFVLLFDVFSVSGQFVPDEGILIQKSETQGIAAPNNDPCILCDEPAVFCNAPDWTSGAGLSDDQRCFICFDNFNAVASPIGKITFWGFDLTYQGDYTFCTPIEDKTFIFSFYENNEGGVGNVVTSFQAIPVKSYCLTSGVFNSAPLFRYEVDLPSPLEMSDGWLSILATGGSDGCWFAWCISSSGDQAMWQSCNSSMNFYSFDLAYTLGPPSQEPGVFIPVSNWALFLAIGLIITIAVLRFRKL